MKGPDKGRVMMILPFIILFGFAISLSVVNSSGSLKNTLKSIVSFEKKNEASPYKTTTIPVECKEDIIICS